MNASFEEKSVWITLAGHVVVAIVYAIAAARLMLAGVTDLSAYAAPFVGAIVLMVILLVAGHAAAAIIRRPEPRDERDCLIEWRAQSNSSWVLVAGVLLAITAMLFSFNSVWIAHLLLASLFGTEILGQVLRICSYRVGV